MTQDEIRAMFEYEPATGLLRRKVGGRKPYPWHGAGKDRRYLVHCRGARSIYLHQAVWLYHHATKEEAAAAYAAGAAKYAGEFARTN